MRTLPVVCALLALALPAFAGDAAPPYENDSAVVEAIKNLPEGSAMLLPPVKHMYEGKEIDGNGNKGPYARDYTTKMVYAPERQTALYAGGNHGMGRHTDVWEFHLGSNTWHMLYPQEGGDHARFKFALMFAARVLGKDPNAELKDDQKKNLEDCKAWWKEHVVLTDGQYVTKGGAPLLVGHTWDTLVYEPNTKRMIHGTGAYCVAAAWLESRFSGTPIEQVEAKLGKNAEGKPYKTMWTFDPAAKKYTHYASDDALAEFRGMGGALIYVPDLKKVIWYYTGQNTPGAPFTMRAWDPVKDTWEDLKPNGGKSLRTVAHIDKAAPSSEQQLAYSPKQKKIFGVLGQDTFAYDLAKNEWSNLNSKIPFRASDSATVFAYDDERDLFVLADPRNTKVAVYDPAANAWEEVRPQGDALPKPSYCVGKGYFDPVFKVVVVQSAYNNRMWIYRPKKPAADAAK